jgi:glycosyltransferase involved in cell wall biosynthesis
MKKIWFFGSYDQPNGDSNRTHLFANYLSKDQCWDVIFFCNSFCHFTKKQKVKIRALSKKENVESLCIFWLKTPGYFSNGPARFINMIINFFQLIIHGVLLREPPDIIIGTSVPISSAFAALIVSKIRGSKFVYEIRDLWPEALVFLGGLKKDSLSYRIMKSMEGYIFKHADLVISALPEVESYARLNGLNDHCKVVWIPNPVSPPSRFKTTSYLSQHSGFNIAYIGGFGRFHEINVILEVARKLKKMRIPDIYIHLFGDGEFFNYYRSKAENEDLGSVYFHGRVPKDMIWGIQKEAQALLATVPDSEIFKYGMNANKITNYMLAGRPILYCGPDLKYNPIKDSGGGFCISPNDSEGLLNAIFDLKLHIDDNLLVDIGDKALRYCEKNFHLSFLGKKYHKALLSISINY